jgi:hypothetical protein
MLTPAERERAHNEAVQEARDTLVLERLDHIIRLLTEIRDNTSSPVNAASAASQLPSASPPGAASN